LTEDLSPGFGRGFFFVQSSESRAVSEITLYIDADACPVKDECYRVAQRYGARVFVVANAFTMTPTDPLIERVIVDKGFDAADNWIAERAHPAAIVITADIPLADRCLKAGATVIGPTGRPFTQASIGMALANRALMADLRAMGEVSGGPKPMAKTDRSRFLSALDEAMVRLQRRG
jgi:uncharacterized protein YaiI (UPF0178 family)